MEQHPIPQQISSYEFKLVGDMTLKQFLKAASGIIIAIIINSTKLMVVIKWPLMLLFGGLGLALAFVPFDDRPLETWITSFFKSIYSPTIFVYRKKNDNSWLKTPYLKNEEDEGEAKPVENKNLFVSVKKQTTEGTIAVDKKQGLGGLIGNIDKRDEIIFEEKTKVNGVIKEEVVSNLKQRFR